MSAAEPLDAPRRMTEAEYLAFCQTAEDKWDYHDGVAWMMSGGTPMHALVIANVSRELGVALEPSDCLVFSSELHVRRRSASYCFPDATVVCDEPEYDGNCLLNPTVIVEVLSPSTERYDRTAKRDLYFEMPSVKAILLVDAVHASVDVLTPQRDAPAVHESVSFESALQVYRGLEATITLDAIGASIPMAGIYRGVSVEPIGEPVRPIPPGEPIE